MNLRVVSAAGVRDAGGRGQEGWVANRGLSPGDGGAGGKPHAVCFCGDIGVVVVVVRGQARADVA